MKRLLAGLLVATVAISVALLAAEKNLDEGARPPLRPVTGVVVKWDDAAKTFTLRLGNGPNEALFIWTAETMFETRPKLGDRVTVRYRKEAPMRLVAEMVVVRTTQQAPK